MKRIVIALIIPFALFGCSKDEKSTTTTTAGSDETTTAVEAGEFEVSSASFSEGGVIADTHACEEWEGGNISPAVEWKNPPEGTEWYAVMITDPDAGGPTPFVHWVVLVDDPAATGLPEGASTGFTLATGGEYYGPCPPPGETHNYIFTVYAFGSETPFPEAPTVDDVQALLPDAIGEASYSGTYTPPVS